MKFESIAPTGLDYTPCSYGVSRLFFRGPKRNLDNDYIAFLGGTDVYGRFIESPLSDLVEKRLGKTCVNLGIPNVSVDAYLNDSSVLNICRSAQVTVFQITGAQNLTNRFYRVHPRRNDRFLQATSVLRAIYGDVDFTDFNFTRHMLKALYEKSPERFDIIRSELQKIWLERMSMFVSQIRGRVILFWWQNDLPPVDYEGGLDELFAGDALFVTREMIETLRASVGDIVYLRPSSRAKLSGTRQMVAPLMNREAAKEQLSVLAHREAADALSPLLKTKK